MATNIEFSEKTHKLMILMVNIKANDSVILVIDFDWELFFFQLLLIETDIQLIPISFNFYVHTLKRVSNHSFHHCNFCIFVACFIQNYFDLLLSLKIQFSI